MATTQKMICDECGKKFNGEHKQAVNNGLTFQVVDGEELVVGLCDKHQWRDVANMNRFFNRMYGWS